MQSHDQKMASNRVSLYIECSSGECICSLRRAQTVKNLKRRLFEKAAAMGMIKALAQRRDFPIRGSLAGCDSQSAVHFLD